MAMDTAELQKTGRRSARRANFPECVEGLVTVKDGDRFGDGCFLIGTEHVSLLVVFRLRGTHGIEVRQERLRSSLLVLGLGQLPRLRRKIAIVSAQQSLLLVESVGHTGVLLRFRGDEFAMRHDGRSLRAPCLLEVGREGVPHLLQNTDDLTGLRSVRAGEGRLQKGLHLRTLRGGEERVRREKCLLHGRPELHKVRGSRSVRRHESCMVLSCRLLQALVAANRRQNVDGLFELINSSGHVRLLCVERSLLLPTKRGSVGPRLLVRCDVRTQPRGFGAENAVGALQSLDLAAQQADLRAKVLDAGGFFFFVRIAITLVLCVKFTLCGTIGLRLVEHALQQLHHLRDGAVASARLRRSCTWGDERGHCDECCHGVKGAAELHCGKWAQAA
mmetsp:Transcript_31217/g.85630  ORF Transcript_31217/g.85630 Transcript_31217/m.85630 type:complete len:389 (+) Transcript_31217:1290-2456(+)